MIDGLLMAIATYSRIPTPRIEWTRQGLRYSLCFFPLVGVFVGALELGWLIRSSSPAASTWTASWTRWMRWAPAGSGRIRCAS